jgi:hypothetical protein
MNATTTNHPEAAAKATAAPKRELELPALVAIMWSLAGGMLLGGAGVALRMFAGQLSAHLMLVAGSTLFVIGAVIGLAHGVVLGLFGRPEEHSIRRAGHALLHGTLYLAPALLLGWLLALWVAALPLAVHGRHLIAIAVSVVAWLAMAASVWFAVSTGAHAATLAFRRWPERALGTALTGVVLASLLVSFWVEPPVLWFTDIELTRTGGVLLAVGATLWFYGPLITAGLWLAEQMRVARGIELPTRYPRLRRVAWPVLAVLGGVAVTLIAIPFYHGATGLPSAAERFGFVSALLLVAANAVADELLVRLFVMGAAFALALRLLPSNRTWAAPLAILAATAVDLVLHVPSVSGLGLPGTTMLVAYVAVRMAIPAALFGYLYWRRGLGTAVAAHVAANASLILLVA